MNDTEYIQRRRIIVSPKDNSNRNYGRKQKHKFKLALAACSPELAEHAIAKLCRHFKIPQITVRLAESQSYFLFFDHKTAPIIQFGRDILNWLVVAHEWSHYFHYLIKNKQLSALDKIFDPLLTQKGWNKLDIKRLEIANELWHGRRHNRFTKMALNYLLRSGIAKPSRKRKDRHSYFR